jgi:uncharacterized protein (TIGR01244 family)
MRILSLSVLLLTGLLAQAQDPANRVLVDLADVTAAGKVEPVDGISSAGQPDRKTIEIFARSGYAAVIDMRGPDEDRGTENWDAEVESTGMDYVAFPIVDENDISFESAKELDDLLNTIDGPVLIHCKSGNRVGALLALRESLAGADDSTALEYGRNAGMTRLEPIVRKVLEEGQRNHEQH